MGKAKRATTLISAAMVGTARRAFAHPCISALVYPDIVPWGMAQPGRPPGLGRRL